MTTTGATMSPATAKLECLDCDQPVAVGLPIRVVSSWVGSCTSVGYTAFFETDEETDQIEWKRTGFTRTKACDEHHYKLAVRCSSKCIVRAIDSPETSVVKLLGIYPETPGRFSFSLEIRRTKDGEAVAKLASPELLVRTPDEVSPFETDREIDEPSALATFSGFEYFLDPATARSNKPPGRGTKYKPVAKPPEGEPPPPPPPDRLQRDCKTRKPGAIAWRPCTQGIQVGDDVRIDVTAWLRAERLASDLSLVEGAGDAMVTWTCYRSTFAVPGSQICVRYGVPGGEHELTWQGLGYAIKETLVVGGGS